MGIYIWYEYVRTHLNVETADLCEPISEPSLSACMRAAPSVCIRASPVNLYGS